MKKLNSLFIPFFIMSLAIASCNGNLSSDVDKNKISVTLVNSPLYQVIEHDQDKSNNHNVAYLKENSHEINYIVSVKNNYYLTGTDYANSTVFYLGENKYSLSLTNIEYSIRVTLYVDSLIEDRSNNSSSGSQSSDIESIHNEITYDANGGEYILSNGHKMNKVIYSTVHHPRVNTSIGTNIMKRDGYTLLGWNTKEDGSGEHISLGSRYLDEEHDCFTLYAEWIKYDTKDFEYQINQQEKCAEITKYTGHDDVVSIPEYINDYPVKTVKEGAFNGCLAKTIVFPKSIITIEENAFINCAYEELYFYDNLLKVSDTSFKGCTNFKKIHINAIEPPRYVTMDRNAVFADKMDLLMLNRNTKKLLIYGGSSAYYSIDACLLSSIYQNYEVINIAMDGFFNNYVQMDIISHFINEGDVFLHSVESCGVYQFLTVNDMGHDDGVFGYDCRFYDCLELNYDLLSLADLSKVTRFFDVFAQYNAERMDKPAQKYEDYTLFMDERGDFSSNPILRYKAKPYPVFDDNGQLLKEATVSEEGVIELSTYSEEGLDALKLYYDLYSFKGAEIYFDFACLNYQSLTKEEQDLSLIDKYQNGVIVQLSGSATVINKQSDVLYEASWFADSDYHLDYEHSLYHTNKIIEWLGDLS